MNLSVDDALNALGSNARSINRKLRELKIKGSHHSDSCPIANYLKKTCDAKDPLVTSLAIHTYGQMDQPTPIREHAYPLSIQQWVHAFDKGLYPEFEQTAPIQE